MKPKTKNYIPKTKEVEEPEIKIHENITNNTTFL
jgi:hypothetical protein